MGWKKISGLGSFCGALSNLVRSQVLELKRKGTHTPSDPAAVGCGSGNTFCSLTSSTSAPVRSVCVYEREENGANHSQMFHGTKFKLSLFLQLNTGSRRDIKHEKLGGGRDILVTTFSSTTSNALGGWWEEACTLHELACIWFERKKKSFQLLSFWHHLQAFD